ncbi:DUF3768 domain-containing protein [Agrobacterium tumefaciens]|uniref:DUF3768 domain-containing protein n=1 Tax=Agrobacterium tumefaciens TaxID=358 RepID=UPI0015735839|nr:DUF3768 domain-containing protein [Agrobacterium tumefaciens]NSZ00636.1 DUF3768 domain-containing protein [Agrobacterium tumefaciens]NSZ38130.1 DUF3768 domain-containing protein [Agrobacterium tumefaciens]NTB25623.1 DUF3768 domain-containing protein [Agrobacterium tumefaciens]NTB27034.1 DUF3768 domain-containing protein [Agrobacterium tumefaciens]NTB32340.1 DUF3768 domain-containing protein [Agrobacterium tumefaciens]
MTTTQTARIRQLNDIFRTTWLTGTVLMTSGIKSLSDAIQSGIVEAVQTFDAFTPDNDPHGEHDFGAVTIEDRRVFWKIDYYDRTMQYGSEDPANPAVTKRVLTIMLAEEY